MLKLLVIHRQFAGVEHMHAEIDERDNQEQVQRGDHMGADQRCEFAQAENPCDKNNQYRCKPDGRVDANNHAQSQTPC